MALRLPPLPTRKLLSAKQAQGETPWQFNKISTVPLRAVWRGLEQLPALPLWASGPPTHPKELKHKAWLDWTIEDCVMAAVARRALTTRGPRA
eukprot:14689584-Alexandrium_andersonii.AAC.1